MEETVVPRENHRPQLGRILKFYKL
jgi:hypothetical protein